VLEIFTFLSCLERDLTECPSGKKEKKKKRNGLSRFPAPNLLHGGKT